MQVSMRPALSLYFSGAGFSEETGWSVILAPGAIRRRTPQQAHLTSHVTGQTPWRRRYLTYRTPAGRSGQVESLGASGLGMGAGRRESEGRLSSREARNGL